MAHATKNPRGVDEDDEPLNKFSSRLELYYAQLERSISPVSGRIAGVTA